MRLPDLDGRRVAIWGTGREGLAALKACPSALFAVDDNATTDTWEGIPVYTDPARLAEAEIVIKSPGISPHRPVVVALKAQGVTFTSGTALWMAANSGRTIGITGSKGKSTTSNLIHRLLTAAGHPNTLGGNIGIPMLDLPDSDLYVVELSSYMCSELTVSPRVAVVTALFPDHLDWHGSEEQYFQDKLNILWHGPAAAVIDGLDHRLTTLAGEGPILANQPGTFHVTGEGFFRGTEFLFPRSAFRLLGEHNARNLCTALTAIEAFGVAYDWARLAEAVSAIEPLPHRLTEVPDPSALTFVDDSLATTPQAAIAAIEAFPGRPLTLLVGGADRGVDYSPLRAYFAGRAEPATVIGLPDSGPRILGELAGLPGVKALLAEDLADAVRQARVLTPDGGIVLMSPAAPSYGKFSNYEHRSAVFREAIEDSAPPA
ncbi:UDP-N-acetylmuramoyl-L-alanine--D-glutamate ligase [Longispora albida]|uniref:UDP-N-acetylmuramoyl-L-alanine--D-glutamate ligase n=1 Tax=Longispora albida TaxID=203523 RepID=UPI00037E70D5|nr:UDP-N-acetylmuramoyl-L-alanine--D-glutamate ligase [Longispora albida]